MKKRKFSQKEVLAIALHFFKNIDDIELSIIISIIKRWFGSNRVSDINDIDDLKDLILISKKEMVNGSTINSYSHPSIDNPSLDSDLTINPVSLFGIELNDELFSAMNSISENPMEVVIRKMEYDSKISNLSNSRFRKYAKKAQKFDLLAVCGYEITPKGNKKAKDVPYCKKLNYFLGAISQGNDNEYLNRKIKPYLKNGNIVVSNLTPTKKGYAFLLMQSYDQRTNEIITLLSKLGYAGCHINEFFYSIYLEGKDINGSFNVSNYINFIKSKGYNDAALDREKENPHDGKGPRRHSANYKGIF